VTVVWICPACGGPCSQPHRAPVAWLCDWCVPSSCCGKVPFATEAAALVALARCTRRPHRHERRAYFSPECGAWHLTSCARPPAPRRVVDTAGWLRA
jgi:hypothetical protein